jgi:hypothetical protein
MIILDGTFALGCESGTDFYARTNKCYKERGSIANYVRSSIPHVHDLEGRIILNCILKEWGVTVCTVFIGLNIQSSRGLMGTS